MTNKITDEMIMALADGALAEGEADRVRAAIAADPRLQESFEMYQKSREVLAAGFDGLLDQPVPEAMSRLVLGQDRAEANVFSLGAHRQKKTGGAWDRFLPQAAAAAVVIACAGFAGFQAGQSGRAGDSGATVFMAGTLPEGSDVSVLLDKLPSGEIATLDGAAFEVVSTVRTISGELCREFEMRSGSASTLALACQVDEDWQIQVAALSQGGTSSEGYVPASDGPAELIGSVLDGKGDYEVLDAADEACALGLRPCAEVPE